MVEANVPATSVASSGSPALGALSAFIARFTQHKILDEKLVIHQGREWFMVPKQVRIALQKARKRSVHAGILLAAEWGGPEGIKPGIYLLDLLALQPDVKKVIVNDDAEWMTVCNRPPLLDNVVENENYPQKGDLVLILNKRKECIGYGDVHDGWTAKNGIVRLHYDIGDFLRRERGVRQKPLKDRSHRMKHADEDDKRYANAKAYGNANTYGTAKSYGNAKAHGTANAYGNAKSHGKSRSSQ